MVEDRFILTTKTGDGAKKIALKVLLAVRIVVKDAAAVFAFAGHPTPMFATAVHRAFI